MDFSINTRPLLEIRETERPSDEEEIESSDCDDFIENRNMGTDDESRLINVKRSLPSDKYNFSYIIFYLLGIVSLVPWNFVMTAEDYWMYKFRNTTANIPHPPLTPIQAGFTSDLSVAASVPNTVFLILNALIGHKFPLALRMIGSLVVMLMFFIVMTLFVEVDTDAMQSQFFIITITMVIFMNTASAIMSGGLFGIAGLFPCEYMTAVVSGQALGGIFAAVAQIISLAFHAPPKATAFIYFNVANVTLVLSVICYVIMAKTVFFKFYTVDNVHSSKMLPSTPVAESISPSSSSTASPTDPHEPELIVSNRQAMETEPNFGKVLNKIWLYGFSEWFVFVTTLSVYPSVTVLIDSQYKGNGHPWNDIYFETVINFLIFNSGDYIGRIVAGMAQWPKNQPTLVAGMTIMRVIFVPLLLLCNEHPRNNFPVLIDSDIIVIVIMCLFSFSNGYIANLALISAPKCVNDGEKEMASSMMAAFLGIGLAFGSSISLIFVELI